ENGRGTRSEEPASSDAADSGGTNREGTRRNAPETDSAGSDTTTSPRPGLGNGLSAIHLPAAGNLADEIEREAASDCVSDESEPTRNRNNFRITDAERIGVGS